jgi:hypothetical protein
VTVATDLRHPLLEAVGVAHGFGMRDTPPPARVVRPQQVHGSVVARLVEGEAIPSVADAILSSDPACPVGVVTADCVPVLACSRDGAVVAAIHAGWRGLAAGVIGAGIAALRAESAPAAELVAVVGPHIGACCYEVDAPVIAPLRTRFGPDLDPAVCAVRAGHWMLDLGRLAQLELARSGIGASERGSLQDACTFCNPARFHSYRRDGARSGRLLHHIRASERAAGPKRSS